MPLSSFDENPIIIKPNKIIRPHEEIVYKPEELAFFKRTTQTVFTSDNFSHYDLMNALFEAYLDARLGKRATLDEIKFEVNFAENLENLARSVELRVYGPSRGIAFVVMKPVIREIFAAPFRDRVIHHLLYNLSYDWWDRRFIGNSSSCREGKGTEYGWRHLQRDMRRCSQMGKIPAVVQKNDLSGYFMSLKRNLLFERVCWGLDKQFATAPRIKSLAKFLWARVIFDDPTRDVIIRGSSRDWRKLPKSKSLFFQSPGTGIVIGNLTSQLLSNIYLDQFDRYVRYDLGYEFYSRYVDDYCIVVEEKDKWQLLIDSDKMEAHLRSLGLRKNQRKCYLQPVERGVEFLGAKVYLEHVEPGTRVKKNFRRAMHNIACGVERSLDLVTSYDGIFSRMDAMNEIKRVFDSVGWTYGELVI